VPELVVLAGPNGAGKSTAAPRLLGERLRIAEFVNADVIAAGLSGFAPERVAIEAGRIMLRRLEGLAQAGADFAFETTLASRGCGASGGTGFICSTCGYLRPRWRSPGWPGACAREGTRCRRRTSGGAMSAG